MPFRIRFERPFPTEASLDLDVRYHVLLGDRMSQDRQPRPMEEIQNSIVDAPFPYSQLVNAISKEIGQRPPEFVAKRSQSFYRSHTTCVSALVPLPQFDEPLENRHLAFRFPVKDHGGTRHLSDNSISQYCDRRHGCQFCPCQVPSGTLRYSGFLLTFLRLLVSTRASLIAENLFLRKQLAMFEERNLKPRPASRATRLAMIALARFFDWREALVIVKPETFIKWHRSAFRIFWRWKSRRRGRPPIPHTLRELIREMDRENPNWGEERIADELLLKLGILVSPRTVRKYLDSFRPRGSSGSHRWATFVRNHATSIVACDFFTSVTASFRVLYVFVVMEIGSRRILHTNVTAHPTAEWTVQQFREFLAFDHPYRFVIHDRDGIFSPTVDATLKTFGVRVLKTPVRAPKANAFCERVVGTIRRECLDFLIPINERHLQRTVGEFVTYYNRGRPHSALGPGIPEPSQTWVPAGPHRHKLPTGFRVMATPVLGGLHHEYGLEKEAA